jgi:predicted AAA+ superfamily ATPase
MYRRLFNPLKNNSFFLLGARGTGKTSLIKQLFINDNENCIFFDFLDIELELEFKKNPSLLKERVLALSKLPKWIILDEIQKVPEILDVVHSMMEEYKIKFVLTGSSARKLKRNSANMLAGRAHGFSLFPLSCFELEDDFNLSHALNYGTLPVLFSEDYQDNQEKRRFLNTYHNVYLKEEIIAEQIIRNIPPFQRFLEIAASANGEILNFSKLGRLAQIDDKSVERYYQILEETLLGFFLYGYDRSIRKQIIQSPKFYFFDLGVMRAIKGEISVEVLPSTFEYGKLFESYVITEIFRLNSYFETDYKLSYIKTKEGQEIDLVITTPDKKIFLIEIKSGLIDVVDDLKWLKYFSKLDVFKKAEKICLCNEVTKRLVDDILIINWKDGIASLFQNKILKPTPPPSGTRIGAKEV